MTLSEWRNNPVIGDLPYNAAISNLGGVNRNSAANQYVTDGSLNLASALTGLGQLAEANTVRSENLAEAQREWQRQQNELAMEFNANEAAKNRNWQEMMSNTAHQREIADLKAAGLNPILSASGGNGASVTSGATASGVTSAGAKGEVDTALSTGLVHLLGTMLQTQTALEQTRLTAANNSAIAERTNAMSELIANLSGQYALARESLSGEYDLKKTDLAGRWSTKSAGISANAVMTAAQISAVNALALQSMKNEQEIFMAENFPNNLYRVVESLFGKGTGGKGLSSFSDFIKDPIGTLRDAALDDHYVIDHGNGREVFHGNSVGRSRNSK